MGLWSALGPIPTSFLVLHGVAVMRTTSQPVLSPEGQVAQVLGPEIRVASVFPPWLSNTSRAPMSPFFQRLGVAEPEGELEKTAWNPRSVVPQPITRGPGSWSWQPQVAFLMLQSLVFCVEKSSPSPPHLSFGARLPLDQTAPSVEELHQESASCQPTVLASPPPRRTSPGEKEPSPPRPAETPWACSVWPHLPSSPSLLPPASTNSAASLCGRL